MSIPDTQHMIRVVAEKFEVKGWKPGLCCPGGPPIMPGEVYKRCAHGRAKGHEIPPPDLLSPDGAWALLVALLNSETVSDDMKYAITHDLARPKNRAGHLPLALLAAAFQLTEEGRK